MAKKNQIKGPETQDDIAPDDLPPLLDVIGSGPGPRFLSADWVRRTLKAYFASCDNHCRPLVDKQGRKVLDDDGNEQMVYKPAPYTVAGMTLALGLCETESLRRYAKKKIAYPAELRIVGAEVASLIKKAMLKIEAQREEQLQGGQVVGGIFALKAMHGHRDGAQVEIQGADGQNIAIMVTSYAPERLPKPGPHARAKAKAKAKALESSANTASQQ